MSMNVYFSWYIWYSRSLLPSLDTSPVFGVLLNRALSLGSLAVSSTPLDPTEEKVQELGKELAAFASDLLLLEDELVKLKKTGKLEKGRLESVRGATAGLEAAHQALILRFQKGFLSIDKIFSIGVMTWTVQWISWFHICQKSWFVDLCLSFLFVLFPINFF